MAALAATSCAPRRAPDLDRERPAVGLYRVTFRHPEVGTRRFRALVFAALPDRLRVEVSAPVGGPELILDSGAGRLAVMFVSERLAFEGDASREAMREAVGLPVAPEALVRAVLLGEPPGGGDVTVDRSPSAPGLPARCELRSGDLSVLLERKSLRVTRRPGPGAGTGEVPPGMEARPLEELASRVESRWPAAARRGEQ